MNASEFEQLLMRLMRQDLSVGTETFRDELLARCMDALNTNEATAFDEGTELSDAELDLLAAAGDIYLSAKPGLT